VAFENQNIEIWAGDDVELDVSLFEEDGTTPLDLTGSVVNWALVSAYDMSLKLISKTSSGSGGITVVDISNGLLKILIADEDTASLGGQPYYHEIEVVVGGATVTVMTGAVTINKTVLH
jgi:hypothetical protein